jgi:hypothetical protein
LAERSAGGLIGRGGAPADEHVPIKIASGTAAATRMAAWRPSVQRNLREIGRLAIATGDAAPLRRRRSIPICSVTCRVR